MSAPDGERQPAQTEEVAGRQGDGFPVSVTRAEYQFPDARGGSGRGRPQPGVVRPGLNAGVGGLTRMRSWWFRS